jgi:hypothetical protein
MTGMSLYLYNEPTTDSELDTPARQVLNTQELASVIVRFLNEPGEGSKDRLRALASVTTVNWAFFHASTDELWYRLPSVLPALHLLPGNCQFEKLANVVYQAIHLIDRTLTIPAF